MRVGMLSDPNNFHCRKWAQALINAGFEVQIFSLFEPKQNDIPCTVICTNWKLNHKVRYPAFFMTAQKLKKVLLAQKIQVLYALGVTPYGSWGMWSGFQPLIVAALGTDILEFSEKVELNIDFKRYWGITNQFQALKRKVLHSFYKSQVVQVLQKCATITADHELLIEIIQKEFNINSSKLHLIRWGIDAKQYESIDPSLTLAVLGVPSDKPLILSPRGLSPVYQADVILEAFLALLPIYQDIHFLMLSAGYPAHPGFITLLEQTQKRYPNFHFLNYQLSSEQMCLIWRNTDIFISCPVMDAYSAAVAEGRYFGALPIVNAIDANTKIMNDQEHALFLDNFNTENLIKTLHYAIQNIKELRTKFARANQKWIQEFGLINESIEIFKQILLKYLNSF